MHITLLYKEFVKYLGINPENVLYIRRLSRNCSEHLELPPRSLSVLEKRISLHSTPAMNKKKKFKGMMSPVNNFLRP
jgi:hypothetical protein